MNKKALIFDLDGTLLDSIDDLSDSTNYALSLFNYPQYTNNEIKNFVGNGVEKLIERAIPYGIKNENYNECIEIFKKYYSKNMYNKTRPYKQVEQMLNRLKNTGYKIAVVSNKFDAAVKNLCNIYFPNLIDIALGENEITGVKKKPSPDLVLYVINKFKINKKEAIYIGDSEVDILTSKNAGVDCLSVSWGFKTKDFLIENGATHIIDNPLEIFKYL